MARVRFLGVTCMLLALLGALLVSTTSAGAAEPKHRHRKPITPCSRGLVALTFDDGPSATVTPRLVRTLERLDVPATFFMVGRRVAAFPEVARLVERAGFRIGNHTWNHTDLTTQTAAEERLALRLARHAMLDAGLTPTPLMRPPYGALDAVARRVIERAGYVPVLWTIDSLDWTGLSPRQIEARVLDGVTRHGTNIVLQHDGVTNSPASLRAVADQVTTLRRRGFCFAALDDAGRPTPPVPTATITKATPRVDEGGRAELTVRLDRPTSRRTSVRVVLQNAAFAPDVDWGAKVVRFEVGDRVAKLSLAIRDDRLDEPKEDVGLVLTDGRGVAVDPDDVATVTVVDTDGPPTVSVTGAAVTASNIIPIGAPVSVRLDRLSGHDVRIRVRTHRETAGADDYLPVDTWVLLPAGQRFAETDMPVLPGPVGEQVETVRVDVLDVRHALLAGAGTTSVTIRPAAVRVPPRMLPPGPDWS